MNNTISGIFITVGMFVASPYYAVCMLIGTTSGTLSGLIFNMDRGALANGIYGFNGSLVGIGIALFQFGGDDQFHLLSQEVGPIVSQSILSTIFVAGLGNLFVGKFGISPFTIPFILSVWIWLLGGSGAYGYSPVNGGLLQPRLNVNPVEYSYPELKEYTASDVIQAIFKGISQVYFMPSTACGVIMLVGIAICSPIAAFSTLLGSTVSTLTAIALGASPAEVYYGLWGFSAVLSAIAIGGMFFVLDSISALLYTVFAAYFSAVIHGAIKSYMAPFGLPGFTFPFNCVAWVFCLAGGAMSNLRPVPISELATPEEHINRVRLERYITNVYKDIAPIN